MTPTPSDSHWSVVTRDWWPTIQLKGQDRPFITFENDTVLGSRAACGWAEAICMWMNEQMRLGFTENQPRNCDPMLLAKLRETEERLSRCVAENEDLKRRLSTIERANESAAAALKGFSYGYGDWRDIHG